MSDRIVGPNVTFLESVQDTANPELRRETAVVNSGSDFAAECRQPVGARISWGAIFAGAAVSLGIYFLLGILGTAVGLSISERMNPTTLTNGAIAWAILTTCVALFCGGVVASILTVGEDKIEAMLYGLIMWSVLITFFVALGAAGVNSGLNAMAELSDQARNGTAPAWKAATADTAVPLEKNTEQEATPEGSEGEISAPSAAAIVETGTRLTWYSFCGLWLSMLTAALGSLVGAGPRFRFVDHTPVSRPQSAPIPVHRK